MSHKHAYVGSIPTPATKMKTIFSITRDTDGDICYVEQQRCFSPCDDCEARFRCYTSKRFIVEDSDLVRDTQYLRKLFGAEYDEIVAFINNSPIV